MNNFLPKLFNVVLSSFTLWSAHLSKRIVIWHAFETWGRIFIFVTPNLIYFSLKGKGLLKTSKVLSKTALKYPTQTKNSSGKSFAAAAEKNSYRRTP